LCGKFQTRDRHKLQEIDANKESFVSNGRDSAEDATDGIYGAL
jgi:hypothetical protein